MIQAKFGLNWPSGFRGEDFLKSLQTDDGRQVMAIAHTGEICKNVQHVKIYLPCNFEVNPIIHFGVISLFS
jgi:hypothetical protein